MVSSLGHFLCTPHKERDDEQDQENDEQDLCYFGRSSGDSYESKNSGRESDD